MDWITIERPGYSGKERDKKHSAWDEKYGHGNWRTAWKWNGGIVTRDFAYQLYEDGYFADSINRPEIWGELIKTAREVYDIEERDVESGLDYLIQKGLATHLQDISIRRVVQRRGWQFQGSELVRIRGHKEKWGMLLSPGKIPFHLPNLIDSPPLKGWWNPNSIEDFYQSNKVLQAKRP